MGIEHYRFSTDERDIDCPLVSVRDTAAAMDALLGKPVTFKVKRVDGKEMLRRTEDLQEPEFHLRGTIGCWLRVNAQGVVTGIEFNREGFNASYTDGISFAKPAGQEGDGYDLNVQTVDAIAEQVERVEWDVLRVEDDHGTVYMDGDPA